MKLKKSFYKTICTILVFSLAFSLFSPTLVRASASRNIVSDAILEIIYENFDSIVDDILEELNIYENADMEIELVEIDEEYFTLEIFYEDRVLSIYTDIVLNLETEELLFSIEKNIDNEISLAQNFGVTVLEMNDESFLLEVIDLDTGAIYILDASELQASGIIAILTKIFFTGVAAAKAVWSKITLTNAIATVTFNATQLQRKFKHAVDFGISGNWNTSNRLLFQNALQRHVNNATSVHRSTLTDGTPVLAHLIGNLAVFTDVNGRFISGWRLSAAQLNFHRAGQIIMRR